MMDNDPKHTSGYAAEWMRRNSVNWWKTPPDLNPIENLWHELKEYIRREIKPKTKDKLVTGIVKFWETVDTAKCLKYVGHHKKVIPKVIQVEGAATGY
jgi:transposase